MNNLPMHEVSGIGWKLLGEVESSSAELLPISLMATSFHWDGMAESVQQELKRSQRALKSAGHLLKIRQVIRSKGDGDEEDFILLIAAWISPTVNSSQQNSFSGGGGDGIHVG